MKKDFEQYRHTFVISFDQTGGKNAHSKNMTNEERLKSMNTKELAHELSLIATWDRKQLNKAKNSIGLEEFMEIWLRTDSHSE